MYNSPYNLVSLKTWLHRRLHTDEYYGWANSVIISAYHSANGNKARQRSNSTQNNEFSRICDEYNLDKTQRDRIHHRITKKGELSLNN